MSTISPPYVLPDLRPFHVIQNRMLLQGGAVVTENGTLESDDFVAGISGWAINGQGDAEFNDLTARGDLVARSLTSPARVSLLSNGTFETDVNGWTAGANSVISQSATEKHAGTYSLRVMRSSGSGDCSAYTELAISPGIAAFHQAHVLSDTTSRWVLVYLQVLNASNQVLLDHSQLVITGDPAADIFTEVNDWVVAADRSGSYAPTKVRLTVTALGATTSTGVWLDAVVFGTLSEVQVPYITTDDGTGQHSFVTPNEVGFFGQTNAPFGLEYKVSEVGEQLFLRGPGGIDYVDGGLTTPQPHILFTQQGPSGDAYVSINDADKLYIDTPGGDTTDLFAAWTAYNPTNTNVSIGNGHQDARYMQIGKLIFFRYTLRWGSTTNFSGGDIEIGLPKTSKTLEHSGQMQVLDAAIWDNDSGGSPRLFEAEAIIWSGASNVRPYRNLSGRVDGTTPHTWAANDVLSIQGVYEAA